MRYRIVAISALILLLAVTLTAALNAGNIDLIYYNRTTKKPIYEVQFLTVPLAYQTGNPNVIIYGAGTSFKVQVTNYESSKGGVIVKLVNVYDGTERVIGSLNTGEVTKEFTISNLYPGYWKIVIVGTDGLPTWDISNAAAPTNAGAHVIKITGNPKLIVALMNPSRNITIGDCARLKIQVVGLYGTTNVSVDVLGQHTLHYSRVLGGANGNTWMLNIPTEKIGIGRCEVKVRAMGVTGTLSFNVVPVKVSINTTSESSKAGNASMNSTMSSKKNVSEMINSSNNTTGKIKGKIGKESKVKSNASENRAGEKTEKTGKKTNMTGNLTETVRGTKTPGFGLIAGIAGIIAVAVLRRIR